MRVEGLSPGPAGGETASLRLTSGPSVSLAEGNIQTVPLRPDGQGNVTFQRQVTALIPGTFQINARLIPPNRGP